MVIYEKLVDGDRIKEVLKNQLKNFDNSDIL